jgi:hypothetical protein
MTKDTCLSQDPDLLRVFKSSPQKIFGLIVLYASHIHLQETKQKNKKTIHQSIQTGTKASLN